jgi:serine O-acetyltransferase
MMGAAPLEGGGRLAAPREGSMLKQDVLRTYQLTEGGRLARILRCMRSPGVQAVVTLRFGQWLLGRNLIFKLLLTPLYVVMNHIMKTTWGIDIPRRAQIGEGLYIGHYGGIFISELATLGKNVNLSQDSNIGWSGKGEKRGCPTLGDDVYVGPGARVFGKITVGNNVKIGANAVIYEDIPENAVVVLSPGYKIISYKGNYPLADPDNIAPP